MDRRTVLATAAAIPLAGCVGGNGNGEEPGTGSQESPDDDGDKEEPENGSQQSMDGDETETEPLEIQNLTAGRYEDGEVVPVEELEGGQRPGVAVTYTAGDVPEPIEVTAAFLMYEFPQTQTTETVDPAENETVVLSVPVTEIGSGGYTVEVSLSAGDSEVFETTELMVLPDR